MKKPTIICLSTLFLATIVGCSTSQNAQIQSTMHPLDQIKLSSSILDTLPGPGVSASPTLIETPMPPDMAATISAQPTPTSAPPDVQTPSALLPTPLAIETGVFRNASFGMTPDALQAWEGTAPMTDDGNGDCITYQNIQALHAQTGTARYSFDSFGKLNRIQYIFRLNDADPAVQTFAPHPENQILRAVDSISDSIGQPPTTRLLEHTWSLDPAEQNTFLQSNLAQTSIVLREDPDNPLFIWSDENRTEQALASFPSSLPAEKPALSISPSTSSYLVPLSPLSSASAVVPSALASPSEASPASASNTPDKGFAQMIEQNPADRDALLKALQAGAYLTYAWQNPETTVLMSIRREPAPSDELYAVVTWLPSKAALPQTVALAMPSTPSGLLAYDLDQMVASASDMYSIAQLYTLVDSNGLLAESQLKDRAVIISGEILSIDRNEHDEPSILLKAPLGTEFQASFQFHEDSIPSLLSLKKGDVAQIAGVYQDHNASGISFTHCQLRPN